MPHDPSSNPTVTAAATTLLDAGTITGWHPVSPEERSSHGGKART